MGHSARGGKPGSRSNLAGKGVVGSQIHAQLSEQRGKHRAVTVAPSAKRFLRYDHLTALRKNGKLV